MSEKVFLYSGVNHLARLSMGSDFNADPHPWMDIAEPVMWPMPEQGAGEAFEAGIEDAVFRLSLTNLRTFTWIRDAEKAGHLSLTVWRFSIATGELTTV